MPPSSPGPASCCSPAPSTPHRCPPAVSQPGSPAPQLHLESPTSPARSPSTLAPRLPQPTAIPSSTVCGRARHHRPGPAWGPRFRVGGSLLRAGRSTRPRPSGILVGLPKRPVSGTVLNYGKPGPLGGALIPLFISWLRWVLAVAAGSSVFAAACRTFSVVATRGIFVAACGIQFPDQGSNPSALHSGLVLTAGPPGKSQVLAF